MSKTKSVAIIITATLFLGVIGICVAKSASKNISKNQDVEQIEYEANYYSYLEKINLDNVSNVSSMADWAIDISNVESLKNSYTNVFIGTVDSMDGCSTTISSGSFSSMPNTYGKIKVLKNLKGKIDNSNITYARPGGIISIAEYEKNASSELKANRDKHRAEAGQENLDLDNTYLNYIEEEDIKFEVGKTYLFFATFIPSTSMYQIGGAQYGTREVIESLTKRSGFRLLPNESKLQIKNNDTGKYELLDNFISKYFK